MGRGDWLRERELERDVTADAIADSRSLMGEGRLKLGPGPYRSSRRSGLRDRRGGLYDAPPRAGGGERRKGERARLRSMGERDLRL